MNCELNDVAIGDELPEDCGLSIGTMTITRNGIETSVKASWLSCRSCGSQALQGAVIETDPRTTLTAQLNVQLPLAKKMIADLIGHCPRLDAPSNI